MVIVTPILTTMGDAERRKAVAKAFDYLTDDAYASGVVSLHLFAWK